ncbi:hypothetical protein CR51_34660 [Caballeronia megalochromosomata]|nr:hypothetical protein CR51_34660 [Caballeronia megalochromosomata]
MVFFATVVVRRRPEYVMALSRRFIRCPLRFPAFTVIAQFFAAKTKITHRAASTRSVFHRWLLNT